jgi:hypothetical protein
MYTSSKEYTKFTVKTPDTQDMVKYMSCDSRYYDTVGIRKMYQYIQTINITSIEVRFCIAIRSISI